MSLLSIDLTAFNTEKNSKKMGDYLKKKLADEIRVKQEQILIDNSKQLVTDFLEEGLIDIEQQEN